MDKLSASSSSNCDWWQEDLPLKRFSLIKVEDQETTPHSSAATDWVLPPTPADSLARQVDDPQGRFSSIEMEEQVTNPHPSAATPCLPSPLPDDSVAHFQGPQEVYAHLLPAFANENITYEAHAVVPEIRIIQATPTSSCSFQSQTQNYAAPPLPLPYNQVTDYEFTPVAYNHHTNGPELQPAASTEERTLPPPGMTLYEYYRALVAAIKERDAAGAGNAGAQDVDFNRSDALNLTPTAPLHHRRYEHRDTDDGVTNFIQYQGQLAYHDNTTTQLSDAMQLIGAKRNADRATIARPWGLQRILTHTFVEQQAANLGVPVPFISDADIGTYCVSAGRTFDVIHSTFPPEWIDIRLLGNLELTAEELLTFFPNHLKWHDCIFRLVQNGWSPHDMANYINYTRGLVKPNDKRGNTVLKWLQAANQDILNEPKQGFKTRGKWSIVGFSPMNWVPYKTRTMPALTDYFLVDLSAHIDFERLPTGDGARLLTRAIIFALKNGHYNVKLSQVREYIRTNLLFTPLLPPMINGYLAGQHPDTVARKRAHALMEGEKRQRKQMANMQ